VDQLSALGLASDDLARLVLGKQAASALALERRPLPALPVVVGRRLLALKRLRLASLPPPPSPSPPTQNKTDPLLRLRLLLLVLCGR
jgi:hypothetical protein